MGIWKPINKVSCHSDLYFYIQLRRYYQSIKCRRRNWEEKREGKGGGKSGRKRLSWYQLTSRLRGAEFEEAILSEMQTRVSRDNVISLMKSVFYDWKEDDLPKPLKIAREPYMSHPRRCMVEITEGSSWPDYLVSQRDASIALCWRPLALWVTSWLHTC